MAAPGGPGGCGCPHVGLTFAHGELRIRRNSRGCALLEFPPCSPNSTHRRSRFPGTSRQCSQPRTQMSPPSLIDTHPNLAGTAPVALSYELFPPRSPAAAESLWTTIGELETTEPDYVSVTYGASGSNRDTAVELINRLVQETTLRPLAHLTCVGEHPAGARRDHRRTARRRRARHPGPARRPAQGRRRPCPGIAALRPGPDRAHPPRRTAPLRAALRRQGRRRRRRVPHPAPGIPQ